jgi:tyrosinase
VTSSHAISCTDFSSALKPFHSDSRGSFWTSASARSVTSFGYTYKDLGNGSVAAVKAAINSLYGSSSSGAVTRRDVNAAEIPGEVQNGSYREYAANILSQKFALNGTYAIYVFVGEVDGDTPADWPLSPNLAGTHAVFSNLPGPDSAKDQQSRKRQASRSVPVSGSIPLTSTLLQKVNAGELPGMDPDEVTPYLQKNLKWRVSMLDGGQVPIEQLANDLTVTVVTAEVQPATADDNFPVWGQFTELTNITQGKPGGCR